MATPIHNLRFSIADLRFRKSKPFYICDFRLPICDLENPNLSTFAIFDCRFAISVLQITNEFPFNMRIVNRKSSMQNVLKSQIANRKS